MYYYYIFHTFIIILWGLSWSWSYGNWIYNHLCNLCLSVSPLKLWVRIQFRRGVLDTTLCDRVCQWLATGLWISPGTPVFSTNKTNCHDITEILFKVALNTTTLTLTLLVYCHYPNIKKTQDILLGR
jgi:hypothetical protein